jgi:hypothetical protein
MRCLYCGKELALLKRLRGGGDFCSDAHKQSYQEEYNRLALSRLLQAQTKGQQAHSAPAQAATPPPNASVASASVALEERSEQDAPPLEVAVTEALEQAVPEAALDAVVVEELPTEEGVDESSLGTEPEPAESAGFLFESLAVVALAEETPYLEPWLELSPGPAMSDWQVQNGAFSLSAADLLALDLRPNVSSIGDHRSAPDLSPQVFAGAQSNPALSAVANAKKISDANRLPAGNAIAIDIEPSTVAPNADPGFFNALGPDNAVQFDDSQLLDLPHTAIDFPAEDAAVALAARSHAHEAESEARAEETPTEEAPTDDDGPRASLEALSRLHQELVEQEAVQIEDATTTQPPAEPADAPVEVVEAVAVETLDQPEALPAASEIVEISAEEPKPKFATELFEISLKTFPPAKAALIGGDAYPSHIAPLLPHLKVLPLRPKVALATGYVPPSKASVVPETTPAAAAPAPATPVRLQAPPKPVAAGKPAARLTQPKQPSQAGKPVQPAAAKTAEPRTQAAPKPAAPKIDAPKPVATTPAPEVSAKAPPVEKEQPSKPAPIAEQPKPAVDPVKQAPAKAKPVADKASPAPDQAKPDNAKPDNAPSFGIAQAGNNSWIGSLKVKLGLAIVLLVIACIYFLGWGGAKSNKPGISNAAVSSDGSGPSIIMGEGGWVENWAGDPNGLHAGREITIYRPSLKLSDYRLEFQGSIDTKSVGWVFRAADPQNYYAMKLMTVSSGLSPKVALFKYLVANGKQTQVGRVPIELAVQQDTVFNIRVDVRGPQFTTYIQGQQVDSWTDDQLKIGGAGFLNEREERGKVKSVSIRYLSGAPK